MRSKNRPLWFKRVKKRAVGPTMIYILLLCPLTRRRQELSGKRARIVGLHLQLD